MAELKSELLSELSDKDAVFLKLLFAQYDNENLLAYIKNRDAVLNPASNLTTEDWDEVTAIMKEFENPTDARILPYIQQFYTTYDDESVENEHKLTENYLSGLYYEYAMKCENTFLKNWFEFNLNLNNLLIAITCRKHDIDHKSHVLGSNDVAQTIRQSNARDFGLSGMFDQLELVMRIVEESDLLQREKKIDALKWEFLEESTFFNYFTVEKVLVFVLKMEMIERWKLLSVEKGSKVFRELLASLKEGVNFEDENA
jgi:hypothetical protein